MNRGAYISKKEVVIKEKHNKQRLETFFPYSKEKARACSRRAGGKNGGIICVNF
jgi:hypothetical protein